MEKKNKIDRIIDIIRENMVVAAGPTNNVGGGQIAGTPQADPGNPPVFRSKKKNIYLGLGSRSKWLNYLKNK
jgi:hypothetical protein